MSLITAGWMMKLLRAETILLVLSVVVSLVLRGHGTLEKRIITYDEALSYLAATGHMGELGRLTDASQSPNNTWVKAFEWKRFVLPEDRFVFGRIQSDLLQYSTHPPAYFWLLHLWVLIVGADPWSGTMLNILMSMLTLTAIWLLGRRLLGSSNEASLSAAVWAVSPAVVASSWIARMYELAAILSVLMVLQVARVLDYRERLSVLDVFLLAVLAVGCVLTHYLLVFVLIVPSIFLLCLCLTKHDPKRALLLLLSLLLGCGVALTIIQDPLTSFSKQQSQVQMRGDVPTLWAVDYRIHQIVHAHTRFFLPDRFLNLPVGVRYAILLLPYTLLVWVVSRKVVWPARNHCHPSVLEFCNRSSLVAVFFLIATSGTGTLLYLSFLLMTNQFTEYKLSMVWPFIALTSVLLARMVTVRGKVLSVMVVCVLLAASSVIQTSDFVLTQVAPDFYAAFRNATNVIVDTRYRGIILPIVQHIPDETPVLAATQAELLDTPERWLGEIRVDTVLVHYVDSWFGDQDYSGQISRIIVPHLMSRGWSISEVSPPASFSSLRLYVVKDVVVQ